MSAEQPPAAEVPPGIKAPAPGAPAAAKPPAAAAAAVVLALVAVAGRAHHSFSAFDMETERRLEGKIVEFEWTNPHTRTVIDAANADGTTTRWQLEGMSPDYLGRRGWTSDTLAPGDRVAIVVYPLRSGEPGGTFVRVTLADGTEKVMFGGR